MRRRPSATQTLQYLWPALVVLLIGFGVTAMVRTELARTIDSKDAERFATASDRVDDEIGRRIDSYVNALRATAAFIGAGPALDAERFRTFIATLEVQAQYPGIQGIGFSRRFQPEEAAAFVAEHRTRDASFRIWPEGPRDEYHTLVFIEPMDGRNRTAVGFDMASDAVRREAMERARDTGLRSASGRVTLIIEDDRSQSPGFVIFLPVYEGGGTPATVEARRARLAGHIVAAFRARDLFTGIFGSETRPRVSFALFDGTSVTPDALLYESPGFQDPSPRFSATRRLDVAGRQWILATHSASGLELNSSRDLLPIAVASGVVVALLLAGVTAAQGAARFRAERNEAELQAHTDTLAVLQQTGTTIAAELDLERLVQAVTDAATRLTRAQFGAFFYNVRNPRGESYTLYTISGVPREAFAHFPMPRNTGVFAPTFRGEGVVRAADITIDPRYGHNRPHHGMPEGHLPVRSYLAVPVVSRSGDVMGGLFFGHADIDVFTERAEQIAVGIAAQAAVAIDNARLYQQVQQVLDRERLARGEAERASHAKDEFLATLSHELRTPLNAILGWTQLLTNMDMNQDARHRALTTIQRNAQIQAQLIGDLLDMSRIVAGKVRMELKDVDLVDVAEAALNVVRPTAEARGVRLDILIATVVPPVKGDADRLQQVIWNLLTNAIKFTPAGGGVTVELRLVGAQVQLTVRDTGSGIDPAFLPYVFDRFRQADGSPTRQHGGLGLGLSIVKHLVESHGGTISVESAGPGCGAAFTLALPAQLTTSTAQPSFAGPRDVAASGRLAGRRMLIVDDNADARELTSAILTSHDVVLMEAATAADAFRLIEQYPLSIDLVVSDIAMPGIDGFEFMRRLRALPREAGGAIPAIALSAFASGGDEAESLAAGYQRHVSKPFDTVRFVEICVEVLTRPAAVEP